LSSLSAISLDEHVPGVGHGEGDLRVGRLAAIRRALAGEVRKQEPRPDIELLHPPAHAGVDVLDDIRHLEDARLWLTESEQRHAVHSAQRFGVSRSTAVASDKR
jgi:hypothetical protein